MKSTTCEDLLSRPKQSLHLSNQLLQIREGSYNIITSGGWFGDGGGGCCRVVALLGRVLRVALFLEMTAVLFTRGGASVIEIDWNKNNKVFRGSSGHLVRVHIGDRLEITCSHRQSRILLTDQFSDYLRCNFNDSQPTLESLNLNSSKQSSSSSYYMTSSANQQQRQQSQQTRKPLWELNCSDLYREDMKYYRLKMQLPVYRYPSLVDQPRFQFAKPYFLIDVGTPEYQTTPSPHTIRQALPNNLFITPSGEGEGGGVMMDDAGERQGATRKPKTRRHDSASKETQHKEQRVYNMCEQYRLKLSIFVEFRDDSIGYSHEHLPIADEIEAENHLTDGGGSNYSSTYYYKLRQPNANDEKKPKEKQTDQENAGQEFLRFQRVPHPGATINYKEPYKPSPSSQTPSSSSPHHPLPNNTPVASSSDLLTPDRGKFPAEDSSIDANWNNNNNNFDANSNFFSVNPRDNQGNEGNNDFYNTNNGNDGRIGGNSAATNETDFRVCLVSVLMFLNIYFYPWC
ncbi:uncharacterized protein DDB_G0286175-like isoform X2 [Symsagittifera roscoffensis]|uniref:uncharacterized protein DDB_G0286175-like isoform X2 n=1 Tax=Symsagittifera roscoffensis TaxID=84072 RepID=UPI00307CB0F1